MKYLNERELEFSATIEQLNEDRGKLFQQTQTPNEGREELVQQLHTLKRIIRERLPLKGYVQQIGEAEGFWEDSWVGADLEFRFSVEHPISAIRIDGYVPDSCPLTRQLTVEVGEAHFQREAGVGPFQWDLSATIDANTEANMRLHCSETYNPSAAGESGDNRNLAFQLASISMLV